MSIFVNKKNRVRGFSLVEICIVCGILMAVLVPVFSMLSQGTAGTVHNRNDILARQFLSNFISFCNLIPFNDPRINECNDVEIDEINLENDELQKPIKLNDLESLGKNFQQFNSLVQKKTYSVKSFNKDFSVSDWPYRYKFVTASITWKEPGKKEATTLTMTGLVTER